VQSDAHLRGKSSFFNLTDGYAGRFIGGLPFAEALQHPLKAVHRFLRRCDLHLPAGGEYPAVEIAAEINGRLHAEMIIIHDLRGNILTEAVDDTAASGEGDYRFLTTVSENAFTERYQKWCRRMGYNFSLTKAADIYTESLGHIVTLPKNNNTKLLIQTSAKELTAMNELIAVVRGEMTRLARELPEYETVRAMYGVGDTTSAQLIAEIGDIRNFPRRSSLVGFAGVDPAINDSGKSVGNSMAATKRGSPHLRKTLFQIMTIYLRLAPQDEPVYQFLDKKRSEGKPYYVYMTAGANKFLRIYYARVKECMANLDASAEDSETAE